MLTPVFLLISQTSEAPARGDDLILGPIGDPLWRRIFILCSIALLPLASLGVIGGLIAGRPVDGVIIGFIMYAATVVFGVQVARALAPAIRRKEVELRSRSPSSSRPLLQRNLVLGAGVIAFACAAVSAILLSAVVSPVLIFTIVFVLGYVALRVHQENA